MLVNCSVVVPESNEKPKLTDDRGGSMQDTLEAGFNGIRWNFGRMRRFVDDSNARSVAS